MLVPLGAVLALAACGANPTLPAQTFAPRGENSGAASRSAAPDHALPPPQALEQFEQALAMVDAGDLGAAERAFDALAKRYPSYSGPLVNLGILQFRSGKLEVAEETLKAALARNRDQPVAYNQLGMIYRLQGRFREAEQAYSRAVEIDPGYANAHLNLGVLCDLYLQQPQRALQAFERYLSLSPAPDEKVGNWVKELKVRLQTQGVTGAGS